MIKQALSAFLTLTLGLFILITPATAQVIVKPNEAGISAYQTFSVEVPNEKDTPTIAVRLRIPEEITHIIPNVKSGWTVTVHETEDTEGNFMTEIEWTEGEIPVGQREDFRFEAKLPDKETTLAWKTYQTYEDGTIISWDQAPNTKMPKGEQAAKNLGPYSETKILSEPKSTGQENPIAVVTQDKDNRALFLSSVALLLAGIAIGMQIRRKK